MTIKVDTGFAEYMSTANFSSPPKYLTAPELLELLPEAPIDIDHSSLGTLCTHSARTSTTLTAHNCVGLRARSDADVP